MMAMNKAERAQFDALKTELALERALRWPALPEPRPMTLGEIEAAKVETDHGSRALGWCMNAFNGRVEKAWSNGVTHGRGNWGGLSGSQRMGQIYRTQAEAALAMRWNMCRDFAKKLHACDQLIAAPEAVGQ